MTTEICVRHGAPRHRRKRLSERESPRDDKHITCYCVVIGVWAECFMIWGPSWLAHWYKVPFREVINLCCRFDGARSWCKTGTHGTTRDNPLDWKVKRWSDNLCGNYRHILPSGFIAFDFGWISVPSQQNSSSMWHCGLRTRRQNMQFPVSGFGE